MPVKRFQNFLLCDVVSLYFLDSKYVSGLVGKSVVISLKINIWECFHQFSSWQHHMLYKQGQLLPLVLVNMGFSFNIVLVKN